ncbi:hypothetical protein BH24ACT3_BH24ACT3_09650 [soil metagenome]
MGEDPIFVATFDGDGDGDGERAVIVISGELDLAGVPMLQGRILEAAERHAGDLVVDMAGLEFMDSSGISVLIGAHKMLRTKDRRLVLRAPGGSPRDVLATTRMDEVFTIED